MTLTHTIIPKKALNSTLGRETVEFNQNEK